MAPPNSYIHVEDFDSRAALVKHLDYLNNNDTAYLEYHQWRRIEPEKSGERLTFSLNTKVTQMSCDLCKEIKRRRAAGWAKRTINSVASWWWLNVHDSKCINNYKLPDWIQHFPVVKMNETYDEMRDFHNWRYNWINNHFIGNIVNDVHSDENSFHTFCILKNLVLTSWITLERNHRKKKHSSKRLCHT